MSHSSNRHRREIGRRLGPIPRWVDSRGAQPVRPLAKLARNPSLRRCGIGFALFSTAEYGEWIAVLVYAYSKGGASASGLLAFAMLLPCVLLSPLTATFADRAQPGRMLVAGYLAQAVTMALLAAALLADAAPIVVYAFAVLSAPTFDLTRPTLNVVMPLAVRSPTSSRRATRRWDGSRARRRHRTADGLAARRPRGAGTAVALFAGLMLLATILSLPLTRSRRRPTRRARGRRCRMPPRCSACSGEEPGTASTRGRSDVAGALLRRDGRALRRARNRCSRNRAIPASASSTRPSARADVALVVTLGLVGRRRLAPR